MQRTLQGEQRAAVVQLIQQGTLTRNARLIEMAGTLLNRHLPHVEDAEVLMVEINRLQRTLCHPITHIAGIRRSGRSPGGLLLRGQALDASSDPSAALIQAMLDASGASPTPELA